MAIRHVHFHGRPTLRHRNFNYSPAVAFMASVISLLFGAFHALCKGVEQNNTDAFSMRLFIVSLMVNFPTSIWATTLPQKSSAAVFARVGVISGGLAFASVSSLFLPSGYKWVGYLICLVACLPSLFPGNLPIRLILFLKKKKKKRDDPASSSVAGDMEAGPPDIEHGNM